MPLLYLVVIKLSPNIVVERLDDHNSGPLIVTYSRFSLALEELFKVFHWLQVFSCVCDYLSFVPASQVVSTRLVAQSKHSAF